MRRLRSLAVLAVLTCASAAAAATGARPTTRAIEDGWYDRLEKPAWEPPRAAFGPVWSVLYALMTASAWLVWRRGRDDPRAARPARRALGAWAAQLALNAAWPLVFFGRRSPRGGLAVIGGLLAAIAATALASLRVSRLAAALHLPYLAWVAFAGALNLAIARRNRGSGLR